MPEARWVATQASAVSQNLPFDLIRFGHDGAKCCIYLGATNTFWDYLAINIDSVILAHEVPAAWLNSGNWSISLITSEDNTNIEDGVSITLKEKVDKIAPITAVTTAAAKKVAYNAQGQITATADLAKSDIGLGNVPNTDATSAANVKATLTDAAESPDLPSTAANTAVSTLLQTIRNKLKHLTNNKEPAVTFYNSGTSWYIMFSNKFIIQGCTVPAGSSLRNYSFPKPMADTNYAATATYYFPANMTGGGCGTSPGLGEKSVASILVSMDTAYSRNVLLIIVGKAS